MAMRNTLLVATGFIALMAITLIIFDDDKNHATAMANTDKESVSIEDARHAFWSGDSQKSEELYLKIIKISEDNINAWGELGNIYYMQARWAEAANAYAEVALQLIDKNDAPQAEFFHRLINRMDQSQSERVSERLHKLN